MNQVPELDKRHLVRVIGYLFMCQLDVYATTYLVIQVYHTMHKTSITSIKWTLTHREHHFTACLMDIWHETFIKFKRVNFLHWSEDAVSAACSSCMCFFSGEGSRNTSRDIGRSDSRTSRKISYTGRGWTNILLVVNV